MSERELRDCLEWGRTLAAGFQRDKTLIRHYEKSEWGVASLEALAADPDVVVAARKVMEIHAEILGNEAPTARSATACGTLWGVRKMLEATFKFRLTDDGYEWADA